MKRRVAASAVVFDAHGRVLLVRSGKRRYWEIPGGRVKKRESPTAGVIREVEEESGLHVEPIRLIGVFFISELAFYDMVFACRLLDEQPSPRPCPPEILAADLFELTHLPTPLNEYSRQRIDDALKNISHPLPIELSAKQWLG